MFNLPNLLTFIRILVIPALLVLFYFDSPLTRWVSCGLFVFAAVTDFFDGYFARTLNQVSKLGRFLDPIADKLLVASVILILAVSDRLGFYGLIPAMVILCREILVSGLREFLAGMNVKRLDSSLLAKWKTTFQLVALSILIVRDSLPPFLSPFVYLGDLMFWLAALLTLLTGYTYFRTGLHHMR